VALVLGFLTLRLSGHYLPLGTIAWGISLYFPVRQPGVPGRAHRPDRHPGSGAAGFKLTPAGASIT
jgi:hypothetical protein